jgi:hypothetical protein
MFSTVLTGLTSGNHNVTVNVVAKSLYATNIESLGNNSFRYTENDYYPKASQTVDFVVGETLTPSSPSLSPSHSPTPSPSPTPMPSIPEFPSRIVLTLAIITVLSSVLASKRNRSR